MPKHQSNVEFLKDMMEFAESGPLMQAFILQACEKYAVAVAKLDPNTLNSGGLISGHAWHACAVELKARIEQHLQH